MIRNLFTCFIALLLASCEHSGYDVTEFTGDYRYYAGIAEFYECDSQVNYYVADSGIHTELQNLYSKLDLKEKEDVYIHVEGYFKEEKQLDGVDPINFFVPVKLLSHDKNRGCNRAIRRGN